MLRKGHIYSTGDNKYFYSDEAPLCRVRAVVKVRGTDIYICGSLILKSSVKE